MTDSSKFEEVQKKIGRSVNDASERLQEKAEMTYEDVLDRLKDERDWLQTELKHEYRNARRFVRANPEKGLGIALAAGVVLGILIGRGTK